MSKIILPQRVWVGRYNAQVAFKNRAVSPNRKVTQFEIEVPLEDGGFSYIDGETYPITRDLVICAKPGQIRHTRFPFKCYYIHMVVREGLLYDILTAMPNFIENADTDRVRRIFNQICECPVSKQAANELLQQSLILELIYAIYAPTQIKKVKGGNKAVETAIAYIKNNRTSELSLETIAKEIKFAPSYFHKLFKAATGKPLHKYIEDLRIERATELLITTEMTLTEIAYECGFSSQSHFSRQFKASTFSTPGQYRQRNIDRYQA